jgi:hypothetical protein
MGKRIKFSNGRRLVDDVIGIAKTFPSAGLSGNFDAGVVTKMRRLTRPKISWNVLYMKAYGSVAADTPEMRQCYVGFPRAHLYQHDHVVCMLTLVREFEGEDRLFFARFNNPQCEKLEELQARYDYLRRAPIEEIKQFQHQIRFAKTPRILRKLAWWVMFNLWPAKRASHVGTCGMSLSGFKGVYGNQLLGPLTTILGTDPLPHKGISRLMLTFDHRVLDGTPAASIFRKIHGVLMTDIKDELAELVQFDSDAADPIRIGYQRVAGVK